MGQFDYNGLVVSLQRLFLVSLLITIAPATSALTVQTLRQADQSYTVITVDLKRDALQLFLHDNQGRLYQSFSAITQNLPKSQQLAFAMNAGMFHANYLPVGLYVEQALSAQYRTGQGQLFYAAQRRILKGFAGV